MSHTQNLILKVRIVKTDFLCKESIGKVGRLVVKTRYISD